MAKREKEKEKEKREQRHKRLREIAHKVAYKLLAGIRA